MRVRDRVEKKELFALAAIVALSLGTRLFFASRIATMMLVPDEYIY